MKKIVLACDLDNTLIHSLRQYRSGDVCVEEVDGKPWGYMSRAACELLNEVTQRVCLIPVTTRSVAQYRRLRWPGGVEFSCAITTHGGVLLNGTEADPRWAADTEALAAPVRPHLTELVAQLAATGSFLRCRMVDDVYAFVYCRELEQAREATAEWQGLPGICCVRSGKKVYLIPKGIDKGTAVQRLKRRMGGMRVLCAGDSVMDIPMLEVADAALAPAGAGLEVHSPRISWSSSEDFATDVLTWALRHAEGDKA